VVSKKANKAASWQRARSDENKDQRRRDILGAALGLWPKTGFAGLTMTLVAERAGLAKGTLYLYFTSKEELCLALIEEQLEEWLGLLAAELDRRLAASPGGLSPEVVAHLTASTLADRGPLIGLLAILESIVEHNIDTATARGFKQRLLALMSPVADGLARALGIDRAQAARLILGVKAMTVGLWHMANPAPVIREVLAATPELALFRIDFASELEHLLVTHLHGLGGTTAGKRGGG
jgi:TetR/AcrR family transcriptional regulator